MDADYFPSSQRVYTKYHKARGSFSHDVELSSHIAQGNLLLYRKYGQDPERLRFIAEYAAQLYQDMVKDMQS